MAKPARITKQNKPNIAMAKPARKTKKEKQARKTRKEKPARITKQNKLTNKTVQRARPDRKIPSNPRHLHGPFLFTGPTHGPDPWSPDHSPKRWPLKLSLPGQLELRVPVRENGKWKWKTKNPPSPTKGDTRNGLSQKLSQNHFATFLKIYHIYNIQIRKGSKITNI